MAEVEHDAAEGEKHEFCRRLRRLQVRNIFLVQPVDNLLSFLQVGQGLVEFRLCLLLDDFHLLGLQGNLSCFILGIELVFLCIKLVLCDHIFLLLRTFGLFVQSGPQVCQSDLQFSNLLSRTRQVVDTCCETLDLTVVQSLHFLQVVQIKIYTIEETLWCNVGPAPQLKSEAICGDLNTFMHNWKQLR